MRRLHECHGQQESQAEERARPPVLNAGWEASTKPRRRVADHAFLMGDGIVLLDDGDQGKPAAHSDLELVRTVRSNRALLVL